MDLVKFLKMRVQKYGERPVLIGEGTSIRYRTFDRITDRVAYGLAKLGVVPGDHVAVVQPNSPQTLLCYYSIIKIGGVAIPISTIYTPREIKFILNNSKAKTLILHEVFSPKIKEIVNEIPWIKKYHCEKESRDNRDGG